MMPVTYNISTLY